MFKIICTAHIFMMVGMALSRVGEIPKNSTEPFAWSLPVMIFLMLAVPAICGYMAGRVDAYK